MAQSSFPYRLIVITIANFLFTLTLTLTLRYTRYELGRNCFLSVLLVTIGLIFTLFYLFFKDQWAAAMFEVFTKKEYVCM